MIYPDLYSFLATTAFGVIFGFVFEVGKIIRYFFAKKLCVSIIIDSLVFLISGFAFWLASYLFADGQLLWFLFLGFWAGFVLERISIGFLLAKNLENIYNIFKSIKGKFLRTKISKKILK